MQRSIPPTKPKPDMPPGWDTAHTHAHSHSLTHASQQTLSLFELSLFRAVEIHQKIVVYQCDFDEDAVNVGCISASVFFAVKDLIYIS